MSRLLVFAVLVIIMFTAFGLAFFVGVGKENGQYSTFNSAFLGLFFRFIEGMTVDPAWFESGGGTGKDVGPTLSVIFLLTTDFVMANIFMAIVVEAYVGLTVSAKARSNEADLTKRNPMFLFLYTYYHEFRKISLLPNEEAMEEERTIPLKDLPGVVVRKWHEKQRRMQLLVDRTLGELSEEDAAKKASKSGGPQSTAARKKTGKPIMEHLRRFRISIQRGMSLPLASDFEIPEPEEVGSTVRLFAETKADEGEELSLKNLQGLMDGEPMLQILLGTRNAIDVVRYFKTFPATFEEEDTGNLPKTSLEKVTELQENIYKKVETLEKAKLSMFRKPVPFVDHMADELSSAVLSIQNSWRKELTAIMEVLTTITMVTPR
jgi:hypothetical protein